MDVLDTSKVLKIDQVETRKAVWVTIGFDQRNKISKIVRGNIPAFNNFLINKQDLVFPNLNRSIDEIFQQLEIFEFALSPNSNLNIVALEIRSLLAQPGQTFGNLVNLIVSRLSYANKLASTDLVDQANLARNASQN